MKKYFSFFSALVAATAVHAAVITVTVSDTQYQTITGFGAAACDGAMCPFGTDTQPVKLLYGPSSKIGLNIMRMEISPNFVGDIVVPEWNNWDSPYDWKGSLPSAKIVKQRGGIVFGTPWSPPGDYKTNGTAQGGNSDDQGNKRGELRQDCYEKFFPWLNTFLQYMKKNGVNVDAVSIQNEPDWWVSYSGCLYTPQQQLNLVKNYAHMLDRETYNGVRLISAEPLGFDPNYSNLLLQDEVARDQIDIIAGHLYGHPPLVNMKNAAVLAAKYGKEVWMTEHSVTDNIDHLPNWHEQLLFAEELNECMLAGCTGYIYWYMRAHWAFVGTGESKYNPGNTKNTLLPRA
ncbi:MAG: endo-1,4-beta-xylanase xyn5A, partial [Prevotella sp.]|nr:endo-1,4-beta-xylanase xyn5A [Prevotella sp.]